MKMDKLFGGEKGTAIILVVAAMAVIMGAASLVLDLGLAYYHSVRLQNAADAAALAAAQELPVKTTKANDINRVKNKAVEYAQKNGVIIDSADILLTNVMNNQYQGVLVNVSQQVDFPFAGVLGINFADVDKSAEALVGALTSAVGIVPLGFDYNDMLNATLGDEFILKYGAHSIGGGWRGIVELDGDVAGGASDYSDWLTNGYDGNIESGDILPVQSGVISDATIDAVNDSRVTQCTHHQCAGACQLSDAVITYGAHEFCTSYHYIIGCPRVIVTPVISPLDPTDANSPVEVKGFAVFVLEEAVAGGGATNEIKATYVKTVVPGDPELTAAVHDFGAYGVRLAR